MNKFGYYFNPKNDKNPPQDIEAFKKFGCDNIFVDKKEQERDRPQWRYLLGTLQVGDELYVKSLGNALRGVTQLSFLLQIIKSKNLRFVSIENKIDTSGILYQHTTLGDVFDTIASLPSEISAIRHVNDSSSSNTTVIHPDTNSSRRRLKRHATVINMYNCGYSIPEIIKKSGYTSKASIFYILKRYAIELNRKKYSDKNKFS